MWAQKIKKEGDIVVAPGSKSKLWRDMSLNRAIQNWNMKYVDIVRSLWVSDKSVQKQ